MFSKNREKLGLELGLKNTHIIIGNVHNEQVILPRAANNRHSQVHKQTDRETDRRTDKRTGARTDTRTRDSRADGRTADRQTDRRTHRHRHTHTGSCLIICSTCDIFPTWTVKYWRSASSQLAASCYQLIWTFTHHGVHTQRFLAFAICYRPSVRLSSVCVSVCNVRAPYSGDWNFGNVSMPFGTLAIRLCDICWGFRLKCCSATTWVSSVPITWQIWRSNRLILGRR